MRWRRQTAIYIYIHLQKTQIMVVKRPSSQNRGKLTSTTLNIPKYFEMRIVQTKDSISRYCFQQFNTCLYSKYICSRSMCMSLQGLFQRILNYDILRHLFLPLKICNLYRRVIIFTLWGLFHNINFVNFV